MTSAALDILDSTDSVILREKRDMDALATSTPRNSMTDKMLISEDVSHVERKSAMDSLNTSEDSHTSEISFSIAPITSKPVSKVNDKDSHSHTQKTQTQSSARTVSAKGVVDSQSLVQNTVTQSEKDIASPRVKLDNSMEVSDLNSSLDSQDIHSADSESLRLNFGPKRENKEWYKKDFYITNTPVLQRKSSESSDKEELSPWVEELSPRVEKQRAHTEEKVRMPILLDTLKHIRKKQQTLYCLRGYGSTPNLLLKHIELPTKNTNTKSLNMTMSEYV